MNDLSQTRFATTLALLIGVWTLVSPAFISFSYGATISTVITGAVIVLASLVQYSPNSSVPSWINGIAAIWLLISAVVFSLTAGAIWSLALSAIAVFMLAVWDGTEVEHYIHSRNDSGHMSSST